MFERISGRKVGFTVSDRFDFHRSQSFISDDEIERQLTARGPYADTQLSIFAYFQTHNDAKDRIHHLSDYYGIGGGSGGIGADYDYSGKGIQLRGKLNGENAEITLPWSKVSKKISQLIRDGRYLSESAKASMPAFEQKTIANDVINFFWIVPAENRPFIGEMLAEHDDIRNQIITMLTDQEQGKQLISKMEQVMNDTVVPENQSEKMRSTIQHVKGYIDGTYSIYGTEYISGIMASNTPDQSAEYSFEAGDEVFFDGSKYSISGISGNDVTLYDEAFPLFTFTMGLDELVAKVSQSHENGNDRSG